MLSITDSNQFCFANLLRFSIAVKIRCGSFGNGLAGVEFADKADEFQF